MRREIEALVAQLYQQQERYERELLEIIRQAHQEYVAYPGRSAQPDFESTGRSWKNKCSDGDGKGLRCRSE